jgi:hypothetical protein
MRPRRVQLEDTEATGGSTQRTRRSTEDTLLVASVFRVNSEDTEATKTLILGSSVAFVASEFGPLVPSVFRVNSEGTEVTKTLNLGSSVAFVASEFGPLVPSVFRVNSEDTEATKTLNLGSSVAFVASEFGPLVASQFGPSVASSSGLRGLEVLLGVLRHHAPACGPPTGCDVAVEWRAGSNGSK